MSNDLASGSKSAGFFEPAAYTRIGWKNIKIEGQMGYSFPMKDEETRFGYQPFFLTLGLHLNVNALMGQ